MARHLDLYLKWSQQRVNALGFYAEHWRSPEEDAAFPALAEKYGDAAASEVALLRPNRLWEVVDAAGGVLYTLDKIEDDLSELQSWANEHVPRWKEDEPWPVYGHDIGHPLVVQASFEFANLLAWLRAVDERLERQRPGRPKTGLLPELARRDLLATAGGLRDDFRAKALERKLANYVLHDSVTPGPFEGAQLTRDHHVRLRVPDRPSTDVATRWHLSYEEERDALTVGREVARAVAVLVEGLLDAFEHEKRAIERERHAS